MLTRRQFIASATAAGALVAAGPLRGLPEAVAVPLASKLSDPALQPKFVNRVANALDPGFRFLPGRRGRYDVAARQTSQQTGLRREGTGRLLWTAVWGYGYDDERGVSWPGRTFQVERDEPITVRWDNQLLRNGGKPLRHLLPVDESLHWCYSLPGYEHFTIKRDGVPIVTHLHGGHTRPDFDGNPEYFFSPDFEVLGPLWVAKDYVYENDQPAGNLWYHDHALGITRLNVYAGLAGFYFIRDDFDTGDGANGLPAFPYEMACAIQDRMFTRHGDLFYPAFPGDPFWDDFITGEGVDDPPVPSALAEFFGDHVLVNGLIWPKADVERRHYRLRLLNGCDSRFLVLRFRAVAGSATDLAAAGAPLPFWVIGSDQGLAAAATMTDTLVVGPGERYDVVFDFGQVPAGTRVIVENTGGDAPFGGDFGDDLPPEDLFPDRQTDRVMAFDVVLPTSATPDDFDPTAIAGYGGNPAPVTRVRRVALFEGTDEHGRLQPLLGTAEPETDAAGALVTGALPWHAPTTENPGLGDTEVWEIHNATEDAHPVHLHLVHFEILDREGFTADLVEQPVEQHNGALGTGFRLEDVVLAGGATPASGVEKAPKDMVTALPGEVTRVKATFDLPGRYVWHCHILSHEDHEMMRVLHVGPGAS